MSSSVIVQIQKNPLIWKRLTLRKSLDEICHYLELELPASERGKIHKHDRIEVRYANPYIRDSGGKRLVTTVLVDELTDSTEASAHSITLIGRSPARDIIDSTWSGRASGTLFNVAKTIAGKFNIPVNQFPDDKVDHTKNVSSFSWENESPWTKLLNEASNQGYLFTASEAGGLYLWKVPGKDSVRSEGFHLTEGRNIRTIQFTENGAEQFHSYVVKGGGGSVTETDDTCKNNRICTIAITDSAVSRETLRRRAQTELRRRQENKIVTTVTGWGLDDSEIKRLGETRWKEVFWSPNFLIPVNIPSGGIHGINLLISQAEYQADAGTLTCTVSLINREAYL
ncbi:MAG: hypothetical protein LBS57_00670 [Treponema sp.]|jgi:prophage tail gpP-like protein|nr:hypothetical protein [Treponema sp.]